jgi:hypothetical protein
MQEERKSMGGALVDVFDAGVTLVKTEIRALLRQVTNVIKAKGIGVVLLLAAVGPLLMGLIFLILAVFYGLMRLGLGAWAAALLIALVAFGLTAALVLIGLRRLSAEVPRDEHETGGPGRPLTEDEQLEAQYQAEQAAKRSSTQPLTAPSSTTSSRTTVNLSTGESRPGPSGMASSGAVLSGAATAGGAAADTRHPSSQPGGVQGSMGQGGGVATDTPDQRRNVLSDGLQHTGTAANATANQMEQDRQGGVVRPGLSTSGFTAGDPGVNASDRGAGVKTPLTERFGESQGTALRGTDAGEVRLPVYEATTEGEPQVYGSGLNKKLDGSETHDAGAGGHGGHDKPDPNIQHPVVLKDEPGIDVSTKPTFQEDMKKEGY